MRTLDQILTKKDYSRKTPASLFYKDSPLWQRLLTIGCVVFLSGAGLGEWKPINSAVGGLPKAVALGVIGLAVLYALFYPCLLYTSPSPRDSPSSRMPSSA